MNKISNTERLAGIIIKILKVIGFVFIGYIIFMIIAVIGLGTYTVVKKDNANVESSATTICSIDNKKYQIEFGTNNYFKCNNCSKKMSDEINEIVDFNNINNSMINIENYFKNNNVVDTEYYLLFKEKNMDNLQKKVRNLINGMASCGLVASQTSNDDLKMIIDNFLNGGRDFESGTVMPL